MRWDRVTALSRETTTVMPSTTSAPDFQGVCLFSEKKYLLPDVNHVDLLAPFWGDLPEYSSAKGLNRLAAYHEIAQSLFTITDDPTQATAVLLPCDWKFYVRKGQLDLAFECANVARQHGLPMVIFSHSDKSHVIPIENSLQFKTSLFRNRRKLEEFALPFCMGDLLDHFTGGEMVTREKTNIPTVGFCGNTESSWRQRIKFVLGKLTGRSGNRGDWFDYISLRQRILKSAEKSSKIQTQFITRKGHFGGILSHPTPGDFARVRRQFFDNVVGTDYTLCMRGEGNYSNRFFEVLSCGRFPVLIDTDGVEPFESHIQYNQFVVRVPVSEIRSTGDYIAEFHARLTPDEFSARQRSARQVWLEWLSPQGFFHQLARQIHELAEHRKTSRV